MLPKIDNTELEKQGAEIISQNKEIIAIVQSMHNSFTQKLDTLAKENTSYQQLLFLTQIERVGRHTADNMLNTTLALNKMLPFVAQIADNVYNIAARVAGSQVTSMKETMEAIGEQQVAMYKKTLGGFKAEDLKDLKQDLKPKQEDEGAKIEAEREKDKEKKDQPKKEEKKKSFLERLGEIFEKVLIPLVFGFVVGLSKALGGFESTVGKIITIFAGLYLALSSFRKKVNELVVSGFKKLFGSKPPVAGPAAGAPPGVPGTTPAPGAPGTTPDIKGAKPGKPPPSGLDKFLENARKVGKSIKDLFVGIADTIKQVLGKLADGIKQFITKVSEGIKALLQNIAKGIESFGKTSVLKGAAALLVVSGALFVAAKAFKQFADVTWGGVAKGIVAITALVGVTKLLDKSSTSMIKGAFALGVLGGALFVAAKGFEVFTKISWEDLAKAGVAIVGLTAAVVGLGMIVPLITAGTIALGIMSVGLVAFAGAVTLLGAGLSTLNSFFEQISTLNGGQLVAAAAGITAIGISLAALGAGQVIGALGNFAAKILSFGEKDIFTKLTELGKVAGDLNQLPGTIEALGKLSNFKVSDSFMKNVDILSKGLERIAEAAKGFEKTGDSLTALARIAEVMNKPAGGTQPAAGTQPAPGKPAGQVQAAPQVYSNEDIAQAERNLATAEKSGNKAAASQARSRLSNMKQQNKVAEATAQATPEQRQAIAEGKPVPVPTNQGQQITTDSQKVAAAQGGGGAGGGQTNIVAPQSSIVNAPQSQTINAPLSAYGIFGGRVSGTQGAAAF